MRLWGWIFHRRRREEELEEEIKSHLRMAAQERLEQGETDEQARASAAREFGNILLVKETTGDIWGFRWLETLMQDVRFGLRMLAKNRGFTALAIITLALGIGGTTAIYSVVYGAVLDPGPYADSRRLMVLVTHDPNQPRIDRWAWVSASEFLDYREQNRVFDEVIGAAGVGVLLTGSGVPGWFAGRAATPNAFRVLGVLPLIGRTITPEDAKPGAPPVVVLSYKFWQSKLGGDPRIVGRTVALNHQPTIVVGVMPKRFGWCWDLCIPAILSRAANPDPAQTFLVEGHLKPGVTMEQAKAEIAVLARRFAKLYPKDHPMGVTFSLETLAKADSNPETVLTLYILLGAVGFLLLISCVNIANLLLARATGRGREIAVRAALGASRGRLVRQFLMESLLLSLGGAVLGCLLAWNLLGILVAIIPPWYLINESVIQINGSVLGFTLGVTLLSVLLFGLAPALHAVSGDLQSPLKASGRGSGDSPGHGRLRNLLVVSEVALSLVLLTGAGVLFRSFWALQRTELGYNVVNLLRAGAGLPQERYKTPEQRNQFQSEVLRRVRALPGVVSATVGWPSMNWAGSIPIEVTGHSSAEHQNAWFRLAGDHYFETLGISLLQGRTISEEDMVHSRQVVVVNRAFVNKYFPSENPLGRKIKVTPPPWFPPLKEAGFEIVGVVADTTHAQGRVEPTVQPQIFLTSTVGGIPWEMLFIRTAGNPMTFENAIRQEYASLDKELPVEVAPVDDDLKGWYTEPRFVVGMLIGFAALGVTLVCIGIYSVLSYSVSRRTHEIGVRMALGAEATDVRRMVMRSGLRWLAVGIGIGVPLSLVLAKILQNRIWGIKSTDPLTLLAVSLVLIAVGLAACYIPARRATKVDPMVALRYE